MRINSNSTLPADTDQHRTHRHLNGTCGGGWIGQGGTHEIFREPAMVASISLDSFFVLGLYVPLALAYLDPGTGSLILQVLLGAIASLAVSVTTFWPRIKAFIGRRGPW